MTISIEKWNGYDINDGVTYLALLSDATPFSRTAQQVQVQPPGTWPVNVRTDQRPRALTFEVRILSGADVNTAQRQLQQWFAPGVEGELEITEDGVSKVIDAVSIGFQRYVPDSTAFTVSLVAADPRWRGLLPISAASLITTSGASFNVNNTGNSPIDDPVISLRPVTQKAAASGYLYKLESIIAWRAARPAPNYAVELTEGWDHATEVGASRSQSDGDDVRVLVDGVEVPRWFGEHANNDANSAATKVWANLDFSPRRTAVNLVAMTAASPTEGEDLEVVKGGTLGWPQSGAILIEDEVITYSGKTESNVNGRAAFTGIQRARRDTTIAAHSASTTMYWIEHRVQIVYGNTGVAAPDSRADLKPLLDLTSSTVSNERHEWINFEDDTYPGRSMQWGRSTRTDDNNYTKVLAPGGSPAANLTLEYQSLGAVSGKPNFNTWYRDFAIGTSSSGGNVASVTRAVADTLAVIVSGIDDAGQRVTLDTYRGAAASGSDNITAPTNPVYRIEFYGRSQVVEATVTSVSATGAGNIDNVADPTTDTNDGMQKMTVHGTGTLRKAYLRLTSLNSNDYQLNVYGAESDGTPARSAGTEITNATQAGITAGTSQWIEFDFGANAPKVYDGQVLWFYLYSSTNVGTITWDGYYSGYAYGLRTDGTGANAQIKLMSEDLDISASVDADDSDQATIDGVTVYLSSTESPYVALKSRANTYRFVSGALYNETTNQSVTVDALCGMSNELRIDIGAGTAVNVDDENGSSFAAGVTFSDPDAKFTLAPGTNAIRFVESGLTGVNVAVDGYPRWE